MGQHQIIDEGYASGPDLRVNDQAREYLNETRKWTKFLAILGFVFIGLMVLASFFIGAIFQAMPGFSEAGGMPFPPFVLTAIYLLMALLYFFPILYLYRFSSHLETALAHGNETELTQALSSLKSHYKFIGILTIVALSFYALALVFAMIGGVTSMM